MKAEELIIMNAEQARKLSEEKQIKLKDALEQIKGVAECGQTAIMLWNIRQ